MFTFDLLSYVVQFINMSHQLSHMYMLKCRPMPRSCYATLKHTLNVDIDCF